MSLIVQKFGGSSVANAERVFNVADIFVTVSTILLLVLVLFYYKEEDFEQILYSGRDKRDPDR